MRRARSGVRRRRPIRERQRAAAAGRAADASVPELRDQLWHARQVIADQQARLEKARGELIGVDDFAVRIADSWAWRLGHFLTRTLRRLILRPAKGDGALPRLLAHARAAHEALGPVEPVCSVPEYVTEALSTSGAQLTADDAGGSPAGGFLDLTPPRDVAGVLRAERSTDPGSVDVVVCVHDALEDLHRCLCAVLECTTWPLRLIVVDDGSHQRTAEYLKRFAGLNPAVELLSNQDPPHGYTIAANIGLSTSTADYVVLLNSDTVVSRGWLENLIEAGGVDERIGLIGPLSNAASHQSIPVVSENGEWAVNKLPDWLTIDGMALLLSRLPGDGGIRVPFLNGFCLCLRRPVIEAIGLFDEERFAAGYGEENDYALRAQDAGFELVIATRAYVHHRKSRSYGSEKRRALSKQHTQTLVATHGDERVRELVGEVRDNGSLRALRARVAEALESPSRTAAHLPRLNVSFVLPGLRRGGSGGSHSIYQEVSAMRSLGLTARILVARPALEDALAVYPDADNLFTPYDDDDELADLSAADDVLVATHYKSVPAVAHAVPQHECIGAYYVQDYEPLFAPQGAAEALEAEQSYRLIPNGLLFAKTRWLCSTLADRAGVSVALVEPSLDRALFHAEGRVADDAAGPHIVAMVRPGTPRRAARETLAILDRLAETRGDRASFTTFGCGQTELRRLGPVPTCIQHHGVLSRKEVSDLFRTADVFLDCSWYQAFGRTGLEAMACGATAVLPKVGGVTEFARHGENCLLADTWDLEDVYAAVCRLVDDGVLRQRMQLAAIDTGRRYSTVKAALSEYALFCHEHRRRRERVALYQPSAALQ